MAANAKDDIRGVIRSTENEVLLQDGHLAIGHPPEGKLKNLYTVRERPFRIA